MLTADVLQTRLLNGREPYTAPPETWRPWTRPASPAPIDEAVNDLLARTRAPSMPSPDDLRDGAGVVCPYWFARSSVVQAMRMGEASKLQQDVSLADRTRKAERLQIAIKAATRMLPLAEQVREVLSSRDISDAFYARESWHLADIGSDVEGAELADELRSASKYLGEIEALRDNLSKLRRRLTAPPFESVARAFSARIGRDFEVLTGAPPAPGAGPFEIYLEAAARTAKLKLDVKHAARNLRA